MDVLIRVKAGKDYKLIIELARRLGLPSKKLSQEEKEDIGLLIAMEEGKKSGIANSEKVIAKLNKVALKK